MLYSISKAAEKTSISSYTLRYYEKIGLLPPPKRKNSGRRFYTETDIQFMTFLKSLKETGMSLEDIHEFVKDGCILEKINSDVKSAQLSPSINKRIEILTKHLEKMEIKKTELEEVISTTKGKLNTYYSILKEEVENK
ncbi:MerR family transcriptional regulator [Bacillus paralicheniformis]|uniref:MerR family transcriptional regulator n=1 Tax=Bacillus paralicheniformis TaxID=1648923 RepID=UPI002DB928FC|nr:MerR family transcriptional regulator [Bacillus paralicheniformis]MEC1035540.1 MerR family transcriptional regulator [Bacillus paralicheniformis]MEC1059164.1 MerR family transcriptional regulator [Bacillus paralicheniformis]MEC1185289.1 MerR family transcriptional regulator [Bacillus paralicheniformis]